MTQADGSGAGPLPRGAVAGILLAMAGTASLLKARSYDLWWHLETGRQIVRSGSIPRADDFSFTSAGTPWIDHEWLFQALLYLLHAAAGPFGFTLLKAACALAVAGVGYVALRRSGAGQGASLGIVSCALAGARFRLAERPETISLALAAAFAALAFSLVARPRAPAARLAALAAMSALWSNLHAGALLGPILAGAGAAGAAIDAYRSAAADRAAARAGLANALAATMVSAVCLLLNPFGWRIYAVPSGIREALSPGNLTNPEWAAPSIRDFPFFWAAAGAALLVAAAAAAARRPTAAARLLVLLCATVLAFSAVRHIGFFFALLPLALAGSWAPRARPSPRLAQAAGTLLALGATSWMILAPPAGAQPGWGIAEERFPEKAADFIDANLGDARLYNDVATGGYLIWRGYPRRRVFIDGRNEVHAALLKDLAGAIDDGRRWRALLDRHGVEGAVAVYRDEAVRARDATTGAVSFSTFTELHFPRSAWALVHWDDVAMVFVRREGRFAALAERLEYRLSRPEAWRQALAGGGIVEANPGVEEEIRRKLAQDAGCRLASEVARVYGVDVKSPAR